VKLIDRLAAAFKGQLKCSLAAPELTREVLNDVIAYLSDSGVFLPAFRHRIHRRFFGSHFVVTESGPFLLLGCYPSRFVTEWMVMHEIGHVLWHFYQPCRDPVFRRYFGAPTPDADDYHEIHKRLSWRGPVLHRTNLRPRGEPSPYGAAGGGDERFCELIGLMYSSDDGFHKPPSDLSSMWRACWANGLSRMTRKRLLTSIKARR
jgi:hypothetical protein